VIQQAITLTITKNWQMGQQFFSKTPNWQNVRSKVLCL